MNKIVSETPKSKKGGFLLLLFIFILLIFMPPDQKSKMDETSQINEVSSIHISSKMIRITHANWGSCEKDKAFESQESPNSFIVFSYYNKVVSSTDDNETTEEDYSIPLKYVFGIIAIVIIIAVIAIKKFRKVEIIGFNKKWVMAIAEQISDEEVITKLDDHTFGVVLSYFDQRKGAIPTIITPPLLQDHTQFLIDLSGRSFHTTGFVEEITDEKVTTFDIRLVETRMMCISYAFALKNPEARKGKENMTLTLLVDPNYGELTHIFTPEILPSVRLIRSLIETKTPPETVASQMDGLRRLITRLIAGYQKISGRSDFLERSGR